jgi:hypothetical protein
LINSLQLYPFLSRITLRLKPHAKKRHFNASNNTHHQVS